MGRGGSVGRGRGGGGSVGRGRVSVCVCVGVLGPGDGRRARGGGWGRTCVRAGHRVSQIRTGGAAEHVAHMRCWRSILDSYSRGSGGASSTSGGGSHKRVPSVRPCAVCTGCVLCALCGDTSLGRCVRGEYLFCSMGAQGRAGFLPTPH
jgi:hypothetical protein